MGDVGAGSGGLRVKSGGIAVLRLFDVANAIDLSRVEREAVGEGATRIRLSRAKPKAVSFGEAPVDLSLGTAAVEAEVGRLSAEVTARIYDFGAMSLAFRFAVEDVEWSEYMSLANAADRALGSSAGAWAEPLERVLERIGPALEQPSLRRLEEDYLIATVRSFDRDLTGERVLAEVDVPGLLSGETKPLSEGARRELLKHTYTYYCDDLVVLTWDRAFVVEPAGDTDVADVLEVANAQLLELRYYDTLLDDELPRMYERVERARATFGGLARRRYANLARQIYTRVAAVTEIAERVDNALIVTEDVYLARIYGAALDLFRVRAWNAAVERKLAIMRDTYTALYDDAATVRAEVLEAAIVLLIVLEILLAFVF
jgi:hypothetical protein